MTTNERLSPYTLRYIDAHPFSTLPNRAAVYVLAAEGLNVQPADAYMIADESLDYDADDYSLNDAFRHLHAVASAMYASDDDFDDFRLELREALDMLDDDDRAMLADDDD